MQYPITPLMQAIQDAYPTVRSLGVYNRRPISGSARWSDHSWGAAWDIRPPDGEPAYVNSSTKNTLDQVYDTIIKWKREGRTFGPLNEKIGLVLWRVRDHYNHIHVQYEPRYSDRYRTPPYSSDFAMWWARILEDNGVENMAFLEVEDLQEALNGAGCTDYENKTLEVDGIYGRRTQSAWIKGLTPQDGGPEGDFVTKDSFNNHRHAEGTTGKPV